MSQRKYTLVVEWFDPTSSIIKQFYLTYFLPGNQIQMYDIKNHKIFLKKIQYPDIKLDDLFLGNVVVCYNRQLKIVAFGDQFTKRELAGQDGSNRTYGMLKPNAYFNFGKMIAAIQKFTEQTAGQFYGQHKGKSFYPTLIGFMTSDYSLGLQLVAPSAITKWRKFIGPTNSAKARQEAPKSLRALYGQDGTKNACHGSDAPTSAQRQLSLIFSKQSIVKSRPYFQNATLCIIKPHAVKSRQVGAIVDYILTAGFQISAMQMIWFDHQVATQFYQSYKFLPQQRKMVDHLASGPAVVLQVRHENVVQKFRNFCGPYDPEIAKKLLPDSLRAKFGVDKVLNGVHCTDLVQDSNLQLNFVFNTLLG